MTPIGWMAIGLAVIIGLGLGSFLHKRFPNLFGRNRKMKKILKDPHLLVEKLKSHGKIYDDGKELDIKVGVDNETGKEVVVVEEKATKKAEAIKKDLKKGIFVKKIGKDKTQTKKKIKKGKKK